VSLSVSQLRALVYIFVRISNYILINSQIGNIELNWNSLKSGLK